MNEIHKVLVQKLRDLLMKPDDDAKSRKIILIESSVV